MSKKWALFILVLMLVMFVVPAYSQEQADCLYDNSANKDNSPVKANFKYTELKENSDLKDDKADSRKDIEKMVETSKEDMSESVGSDINNYYLRTNYGNPF